MFQPLIHSLKTRKRYRRGALALAGGAVALVLISQVAAPYLISTSLVRNGMENAVETWFGHDVTINGDPELHFWPRPHITLRDVTIRETEDPASRMIAHVDELSASFELFRALGGQLVFEDFDLLRPKLFAIRTASGDIDWSVDGLLDDAVQAVRSGKTGADTTMLDAVIGDVAITDGSVEIRDAASGDATHLTAVSGTIDWPQLSAGLSLRMTATLRGQAFTLTLSAAQPLTLLAGKDATAEISLASNLLSGQFSGDVNLANQDFLAGSFNINVPRVPDMLDWLDIHLTGLDRLQQLTLNARLMTAGNALRFEQVSLRANEASATGIIDLVAPQDGRPRLTGTLAFDRLNFSAIVMALSPQPTADGQAEVTPTALLGDLLDLDLRLSSSEAELGPLPLRNAAVSMINTRDMARIDLVDSAIDGGRLTGQISAPDGRIGDSADLRLSLRDADLASVARRFGAETVILEATGSAEMALHLARPLGIATLQDMSGSMRLSARNGRLSGIDLATIRQQAGKGAYFSLRDASDGSLFFDRFDLTATMSGGIAELGEARLDGPDDLIVLSGLLPLETQGLALSANIYAKTGGIPSSNPLMIFIGGAWPAPVLWPMNPPPQPQQTQQP